MFGLNYIIFRPHNVYGERQNIGDRYRNVIGIFINNVMKGKPMPIFGDGEQQRAFSHINDIAPLIACSIQNGKVYQETFNIGADTPYTINELSKCIAKHMNVEPNVQYLEARNEVKIAYSDHSKIKKYFPEYQTNTSLDDGIKGMVDWALINGSKESSKFENIEILEKLPPSWLN